MQELSIRMCFRLQAQNQCVYATVHCKHTCVLFPLITSLKINNETTPFKNKRIRIFAYLAFKLAVQTRIPVRIIVNIPPGERDWCACGPVCYSPLFEILTAALRIPSARASRFHWSAELPAAPRSYTGGGAEGDAVVHATICKHPKRKSAS